MSVKLWMINSGAHRIYRIWVAGNNLGCVHVRACMFGGGVGLEALKIMQCLDLFYLKKCYSLSGATWLHTYLSWGKRWFALEAALAQRSGESRGLKLRQFLLLNNVHIFLIQC